MKLVIYLLFTVFLAPAFSLAQADNSHTLKMEVMMRMTKLRNSLLTKDSVGLSDVLANDVSYGHTNGMVQSKGELIRDVVSGKQDYQSIDPTDMVVRVYENAAVVTLKSKVSMLYQGKPLDFSMNVLIVWVKNEGVWKIVARQSVTNK